METLSTSVSSLKVVPAVLHSTPRENFYFKSPYPHPHTSSQPYVSHNLISTTKPNKRTSSSSVSAKHINPQLLFSSNQASPPTFHRRPATGYAAALLDKSACEGSIERVRKDVKRVSKLLKKEQIQAILNDPVVGEMEKGEVVRTVVRIGKGNRDLAALVKLMIERNRVGMVSEVLDEFERIYDQLCGIGASKVQKPSFAV